MDENLWSRQFLQFFPKIQDKLFVLTSHLLLSLIFVILFTAPREHMGSVRLTVLWKRSTFWEVSV